MVKASGYGSGSAEVARLLEYQRIDYLSVAYADEGVELRRADINLPVLVLNPEEATFDALFRYKLEPEIYSLRLLKQFIAAIPPGLDSVPIHLKLDTGMHRLGFEVADLQELIEILNNENRLEVASVFSHLAASDEVIHDNFTVEQFNQFKQMFEIISDGIGYRPLRHILNSSGIARFPEFQMDMVRLGIGLYGIGDANNLGKRLQTVLTLKATISQIKQLKKGETVGYSRKWKAEKESKIATISIGYADGFPRSAGNGKPPFLHQDEGRMQIH